LSNAKFDFVSKRDSKKAKAKKLRGFNLVFR
jgi:hypothetical protein